MAQLTNTDKHAYINTTPSAAATYARVGEGVTGITPANNPITDTKHYVNHQNPTTKVLGTAKQFALALERYKGDDANDYIAGLSEKIGTDIVTDMVFVDHHDVALETAKPAKKYEVTVIVNNDGSIVGGGAMDMDVAIHVNGDPVAGTFNESTLAFTPDA
ncbi:MAG: hypothetical protein VB025_07530 [Sphaerochaeta sp.]|nr:hypothetical protein [Sphaerochaeta sp.]